MGWIVEKLGSDHERESSDCGKELLNNFLKRLATQAPAWSCSSHALVAE